MDLFQSAALADNQSKIDIAAKKLAILFSDEIDTPKQFRIGLKKPSKSKEDTLLMRKFQSNVAHWKALIETMLDKIDPITAWRFINLIPKIGVKGRNAAFNEDFLVFTDYFILRRDIEKCNPHELGRLAQLYTAFQKIIENEK